LKLRGQGAFHGLALRDRAQAVAAAYESGLVVPGKDGNSE
jgi:hypothetical protein